MKNQILDAISEVRSWQIKQIKTPKTDDLSIKGQPKFIRKDGLKEQVTIGSKKNPVCVLKNSVITFPR